MAAELHCHSHFSFLDGASSVDQLAERAVELGLEALALTDHQGLYGAVRFVAAAEEVGLRPIVGLEVELQDPAVPDPAGLVVPPGRLAGRDRGRGPSAARRWLDAGGPAGEDLQVDQVDGSRPRPAFDGQPARLTAARPRPPGYRDVRREDLRGIRDRERGPHLILLARDATGYRSLCRLVSAAQLAGTKGVPRFSQALLDEHTEGLIGLSGCRSSEIARRLLAGDRVGAATAARRYAARFAPLDGLGESGFFVELQHHLLPDDDFLVAELAGLARELGLPCVVTNDAHYARPEDRELQDVLVSIRHGLSLEAGAALRRPNGEYGLRSAAELAALPPGQPGSAGQPESVGQASWREGLRLAGEIGARCRVELEFERYRFPGFEVPPRETPFSHLERLCHEGARRRYQPMTPAVVKQLAHELEVIERTGLAEFFLICWDLMRFARERAIPAQGRGSAGDSIVAYALGITRVDPIRHGLLFERFINEGRTVYPDVDIDFASSRREEVIQYVYERYGAAHTGMVCNLVTYRARSAVREVGYALGFPRALVDRVAKALETYDAVMVRRDLEADGGFAEFFRVPGERSDAAARAAEAGAGAAEDRAFVDRMGQLRYPRSGNGAGRDADPAATAAPRGLLRGRSDDEGGPGDTPASVAWLRAEQARTRGRGDRDHDHAGRPVVTLASSFRTLRGAQAREKGSAGGAAELGAPPVKRAASSVEPGGVGSGPSPTALASSWPDHDDVSGTGPMFAVPEAPGTIGRRAIDPETGVLLPPERRSDRLGRPARWDPPPERSTAVPAGGFAGEVASSVARVGAEPRPEPRGGSTVGLSPWERWLELCARIDGVPRHLSIHTGGMLVTRAPLVDIAPLERATMPGRVVVQYDKRDIETLKLIKLDLLGLRMLSAIDDTVRDIRVDCGVCLDLDRLPEDLPEVFAMIQAADTVGVFQIESRAQMQTLPRSRPTTLDDLVVEVAIIRPGPIQGNAVHPYLRRREGREPVTYLHPSLEPILAETLGVILYQEQVMRIAIEVAGFSPGDSDGFRRAMGTWRSSREMEKLHARFVTGCRTVSGLPEADAEELFREVAAFASFGFNKSHAAAFARTAYESAFLKLYYPAQFVTGLINAQPMGFYPVEVLVNDAKRHGVTVLPVDLARSRHRTATEWLGLPGTPLLPGCGVDRRAEPVRSPDCIRPDPASRERLAAPSAEGYAIRLGLHLVKGIGEELGERLEGEQARGPYRSLADVVARTGLPEELLERLIRAGALDSLGRPRRELIWQLREVAGAVHPRSSAGPVAGRPLGLRLPPTPAPALPPPSELERLGDSYAILSLDARRQVVELFRPALDRLGAVPVSELASRPPGAVAVGGLVVTRQHPMTAKGTVFLALEDESGMVNVTLWPKTWERLRGTVRRHALLYVRGTLQREGAVTNLVARTIESLPALARDGGGPGQPSGVRQLGYAGLRRA